MVFALCVQEGDFILSNPEPLSVQSLSFELWVTDNNLFYEDKIYTMNNNFPDSTPEFLTLYPISILSRLFFSITFYKIKTPVNDS